MINLKPVTWDNFHAVEKLKVKDEQKNFVAENLYSLAQAWLEYDTTRPFAIYADDVLVGFVMLEYDEDEGECGIWRFMIGENHQGKGYGKEAMNVIMDYIKSNPAFKVVHLMLEPENEVAIKLYKSFGFEFTGEVDEDDGEMEMALKI
jgi:diamine N-acetyltransferase